MAPSMVLSVMAAPQAEKRGMRSMMTEIEPMMPETIRMRASSLGVPGALLVILVNRSTDYSAPPNLKKRVWSRMMEITDFRIH